ncbi:MAG: hypothetical protein HY207_04330 [Nitrospirae bacterium]|nr:hypothetical protein [Nitrospirota bacterium]
MTRRESANLQRHVWEIGDRIRWLGRNQSLFGAAWRAFIDPNSSDVEKAEAKEAIEDALAYRRTHLGGGDEGTLV